MKSRTLKFHSIFTLIASVIFIFALASCSELLSGRETGSMSFKLTPELCKAVSNQSRSISLEPNFDETSKIENEQKEYYEVELLLLGDYSDSISKTYSMSDWEKIESETLTFNDIPVGSSVYVTVNIYFSPWGENKKELQWTGTSSNITIVSGENALSVKAEAVKSEEEVKTTGFTIKSSAESISVGESVEFSATVTYSDGTNKATTDFTLETNDSEIAKIENGKLVGVSAGEVTVTAKLTGTELTDTCKVTINESEEISEVTVRFLFQNDEGGYVENSGFADIKLDEDSEIEEILNSYVTKAIENGYTLNEKRTDDEPVLVEGVYFIYIYFDKYEEPAKEISVEISVTTPKYSSNEISLTYKKSDNSLIFTATEDYSSYIWIIDGEVVPGESKDNTFTIEAEKYSGNHTLLLVVDGKDSASVAFTVSE